MSDFKVQGVNEMCKHIYEENKKKGFWDERESILKKENLSSSEVDFIGNAFIAQMIALVHSELSEALEASRKNLMDDKLPHRLGLEVELADAVIRIFDMCGGLGINLEDAIKEKLEFNRSRPYKHGKKY